MVKAVYISPPPYLVEDGIGMSLNGPVLVLFDVMEEAVPKRVSSPQSGIICVQGYRVKTINAPILEAIFKKHGDIAAKCVFPDAMRTHNLCDMVVNDTGPGSTTLGTGFFPDDGLEMFLSG
nr:phospholipase-like protein [Tanacetum cinerariifolium]